MQRQLLGELRCLNEQHILTLRKLRIFEKRCPNLQVAYPPRERQSGVNDEVGLEPKAALGLWRPLPSEAAYVPTW